MNDVSLSELMVGIIFEKQSATRKRRRRRRRRRRKNI